MKAKFLKATTANQVIEVLGETSSARISLDNVEKLGKTMFYKIHLKSKRFAQTHFPFCTTSLIHR